MSQCETTEIGPGVDGIAHLPKATGAALRLAAQILVNEFSYDGEDPKGVKAYQGQVDYFLALAEKVERCEHKWEQTA